MTNQLTTRYGRWALVAGASAGLGAAFAAEAASLGFDVVLLARRDRELRETASRISDLHGVETRVIVADLADPEIGRVVERATERLDIGVLVYNAAAEPEGRFLDVPLEEHRLNIAVNCWTPTVLAHQLGRQMVQRKRGAIVLVSSMAALQGIKMFTTYGAAKAYELILGEGLWDELRDQNVDVVSYVVGATASANFRGADKDAYANVPAPAALAGRILDPARPEDVARRLFARLDAGPRQYSHDVDEEAAQAAATRPRAEVVEAMGRITVGLARFQKR
jgi:short-subunit dehydrogenase